MPPAAQGDVSKNVIWAAPGFGQEKMSPYCFAHLGHPYPSPVIFAKLFTFDQLSHETDCQNSVYLCPSERKRQKTACPRRQSLPRHRSLTVHTIALFSRAQIHAESVWGHVNDDEEVVRTGLSPHIGEDSARFSTKLFHRSSSGVQRTREHCSMVNNNF